MLTQTVIWQPRRGVVVVAAMLLFVAACAKNEPPKQPPSAPMPPAEQQPTPASDLVTMDVAKAVMVTVELDFGPKVPTIAEALTQVERRYQPDDGSKDRTFSVLDGYGEPTPDG